MARLLLSKPINAHGRIAPDLDLQVASDILIADGLLKASILIFVALRL